MARAAKQYRPAHYRPDAKRVDRRESASVRGYDSRWARLRRAYVKAHPLCEDCLPDPVPVDEVDHIIPIEGVGDPLRLEWRNLRSRCRRCHAIKTARCDDRIRAEVASGVDWAKVVERWRRKGAGR